jgi:hypothetical protein
MPLDLALQKIAKTKGEFNPHVPRRHKLWVSLAKGYFVLFFLMMVLVEYASLRYVLDFPFSRRTMETITIVSLSCQLALTIMYLAGVVITSRKLKRKFFSRQFVRIVANPIGNFLKVLPYLGKWRPSIKLITFLLALILLSPFPFHIYYIWSYGLDLLRFRTFWSFFVLIEPFLLVPLTIYYWKYHVLAQNPVFELMMMHPQGRQLIGETN